MIEVVLWVSVTLVVFVSSVIEKHRQDWRRGASEMNLQFTPQFPMRGRLHGVRQGFEVAVFKKYEKNQFRVVIEVRPVDPGFTLRPDNAVARLVKPDVEIGESGFDERVRIEGDSALALAILQAETRRTVDIVVTHGDGQVSDGMIRSSARSIDQAPSTLSSMLDLARELRRPEPKKVAALLAQTALQDSAPKIRLRAFRELAESFRETETLLATARMLRESFDIPLRLEALRILLGKPGSDGVDAANELARLKRQRQLDSSSFRRVLAWLVDSAHRETVAPTLAAVLKEMNSESSARFLALEGLVKAQALDELLKVPYRDTEAATLARGLGRLGDVAAQPRLLVLLRHSDFRVQKAAAEALGAVGDREAVLPLREIVGSAGVLSLGLVPAAEAAISEIQSRVDGSQQGEISLVGVSSLEGAVSPADETDSSKGGEVSLA